MSVLEEALLGFVEVFGIQLMRKEDEPAAAAGEKKPKKGKP